VGLLKPSLKGLSKEGLYNLHTCSLRQCSHAYLYS